MKEQYDLDFLIKKFEEHSKEHEEYNSQKDFHQLEKEYFNISHALLLICKELKRLNILHGLG